MFTPFQLVLLIIVTMGGMLLAFIFSFPLFLGFILGLFYLIFLSLQLKISPWVIWQAMGKGAYRTKEVLLILLLVGCLIPTWGACGTIAFLIQEGLALLNPHYFLTCSFLISGVVSLLLGTSTGTLSTVGIALMGVGTLLQVPPAITAGALVCGAFVGDRTSPLSSANQLAASCTGIAIKEQNKALLPTGLVALAITLFFFFLLDSLGGWQGGMIKNNYQFAPYFNLQPILFVPPLLILGGILLGVPGFYCFLLAISSGLFLGIFYQGISVSQWFYYLFKGYHSTPFLVLHGKGLVDMLPLMAFILTTGAYNGILEETGIIRPYFAQVLGDKPSLGSGSIRISLFALLVALISCNQTLPIMVVALNLLPLWKEKFKQSQLFRLTADSALVLPGLIPWNMLALLCGTILRIEPSSYIPYAIFLWVLPFLTIGFSYYEKK